MDKIGTRCTLDDGTVFVFTGSEWRRVVKQWNDLTEEEIWKFDKEIQYADVDPVSFANAVIAAFKEKNQ